MNAPAAPDPPAAAGPVASAPAAAGAAAGVAAAGPAAGGAASGRWIAAGAVLLVALATAALVVAWNTQQRVKSLETELVRRQQDSGGQATEARVLARQAQDVARETAAKLALLDARVAETTTQRTQIEELIQGLARSRDETVLSELDSLIRVALQQSAITGSAEPLLLALKQADDRLQRHDQPRLERVRRALAADVERIRGAGVVDIALLTQRLDDVTRQVDELPLLSLPERRSGWRAGPGAASAPAAASAADAGAWPWLSEHWQAALQHVWLEIRSLVRVTRIDAPEAMLVAPDQAYFLRENLKLRLLNARLALLSRQFETAQIDLRDARGALERYFDRSSRRVGAAIELLRQVALQARQVAVPRPDGTLAAIAAASR